MNTGERRAIRRTMRRRRRALTAGQRLQARQRLARRLRASPLVHRARRVALYLPADGELDPRPALFERFPHKQCYLPVLDPLGNGKLHFAPWEPGQPLRPNRFGIGEPLPGHGEPVPAWTLDLILMPLVAWDRAGNRLGMGGGFYDRTLAPRRRWPRCPRLAGIAYRFQEVSGLPAASWDVPLDGVFTD